MQTNILHSVKVLKQEGYDTLDTSPEFLALEAFLYVNRRYLDHLSHHQQKKCVVKVGPPLKKLSRSAHGK